MFKRVCIVIMLTTFLFASASYAKGKDNKSINQLSTQELQTLQTRTYNNVNSDKVMKAIINVLQDKCYFIENADTRIGFILASREFDTKNKSIKIKEEFGARKLKTMCKFNCISRTEADINVTPSINATIVRINFRKRVINIFNANTRVKDIIVPDFYTNFFTDLEKELQINNNKG